MILYSDEYFSSQVRQHKLFRKDQRLLEQGSNIYSDAIREWLAEVAKDPGINSGEQYNSASVYAAIADICPVLKMSIPQYVIKIRDSYTKISKMKLASRATVELSDYMMSETCHGKTVGDGFLAIDWDYLVDYSEVLVIQNDMNPPIRRYRDPRPEGVIEKRRLLDHTILDFYDLIGVVLLHGVMLGYSGGGHYTSVYKNSSEEWHHYDDVSGIRSLTLSEVDSMIWEYNTLTLPYMFFYRLKEE
jgi:hypothetical protein